MGHRYIGSKSKIVDIVISKIKSLVPEGSVVTDLMCGTATVSIGLRKEGFSVIANDLMTYSYHHAVTGLKLYKYPDFIGATKFINEYYNSVDVDSLNQNAYGRMLNALSNVQPIKGYFWKEFSHDGKPSYTDKPRNYFNPNNAKKIDGIRNAISQLKINGSITDVEYSVLQHDLLMAANDVANIAGTYGHYMAKLTGRARDDIKLTTSDFFLKRDTSRHTVYQGYAEVVASKIKCDLCYIDPPYMKRQYAANYHVLETIARGDSPVAAGVSGLRPWRDQYSNFCTKTKIRDSFREIFNNMTCPLFLISYSEDGLLSVEDFKDLLKPFGKVTIDDFKHRRFKSNDSDLGLSLTEYLILLER